MISTVKSSLSVLCWGQMQWLNNRYVQLSLLTVFIAVLLYVIIWLIIDVALGLHTFPPALIFTLSVLGSGLLVYKFFASRIF